MIDDRIIKLLIEIDFVHDYEKLLTKFQGKNELKYKHTEVLELLKEIFPSLKNLHLNDLKKIAHRLPRHIPLVAKLRELFVGFPADKEMEEIATLKISAKERQLIEFLQSEEGRLKNLNERTPSAWARFYAHPFSHIAVALYGDEKMHAKRKESLKSHISRLETKKPLVTSKHLIEKGIKPGLKMGELLQEAETIAIDYDLSDPEAVLKLMEL